MQEQEEESVTRALPRLPRSLLSPARPMHRLRQRLAGLVRLHQRWLALLLPLARPPSRGARRPLPRALPLPVRR